MISLADLIKYKTRPTASLTPGPTDPTSPSDGGGGSPPVSLGPCRKVPYATEDQAQAQLKKLLALGDQCRNPETLIVYRCHNCRRLHVGHDLREKVYVPVLPITVPGR